MKLLKLIKIIIIIFVVVFLCLEAFILTQGKALLSDNLKKILGKDIEIGSLYIIPPYSININNLKIEGLITVEKIEVEPSIIGLFMGKIGLNKLIIVKPEVLIVRIGTTEFNVNKIIDNIRLNQTGGKPPIQFIKHLVIKSAKLSFEDRVADAYFDIVPIDVSVVTSLLDFKTRFSLNAQAVTKQKDKLGELKGDGWLNFFKKDMDAKFSLDNVELVYFSQYFKKFYRKIESGTMLLSADMVSKNNDLVIDCHLETHGLTFMEEQPASDTENKKISALNDLSGFILNNIVGLGSGGIFDFSLHTKFDNPKLEGLQFKGNIFKESIKNIIENPKETIEKFKKAGEDFEKIGKEFKEQFKNIKNVFKVLKTEKTEGETETKVPESQDNSVSSGAQQ